MIVLDWPRDERRHHMLALFGLGLIGSSILSPILQRTHARVRSLPFTWQSGDTLSRQATDIIGYLAEAAKGAVGPDPKDLQLDIVWAAGKGGFQGKMEEFSDELYAFDKVLEIAAKLVPIFPNASHAFHLLSSAGGLFEGQRFVDAHTEPRPKRAYGEAKLQQENKLIAARGDASAFIYRPSTIYGYKPGGRSGLVATLAKNAVSNQTTRIFGDLSTLRDYVFVDDIGNYVASKITSTRTHPSSCNRFLLASGKPTSMHEVVGLVELHLQRRLLLKFDSNPSNAAHMSFRRSALPADWTPTPLVFGVRRTTANIASAFAVAAQ